MKKKFIWIFLSIILLCLINAFIVPKVVYMMEGNGFILKTLPDNSTVVINEVDRYQFVINNNEWYPILLPATDQNISDIKIIADQKGLQIDEFLSSLPADEGQESFPLVFLDLNPDHYVDINVSTMGVLQSSYYLGFNSTPDELILEALESSEDINNIQTIDKNGQRLFIMEMIFEPFYLKTAFFIRNNRATLIFIGTDDLNNYADLKLLFEEVLDSMEFFDTQ